MDEIDHWLQKAQAALKQGDWAQALESAQQIENLDPNHVEGICLQAEALLEALDFKAAETLYRRADALQADDPAILCGLGICLFEQARFEAAHQMLHLAVELHSGFSVAHHYLGLVYEYQGQDALARKHLTLAASLDPHSKQSSLGWDVDDEHFDSLIVQAIDELDHKTQQKLEGLDIIVDHLPDVQSLIQSEAYMSPQTLGLRRHNPTLQREELVLYQRNLLRICRNTEDLVDQIKRTILFELDRFDQIPA